jgi:uncharacterized protein (DUF2249 family)
MGRLLNQAQVFPRLGVAAQKVNEQVTSTENDRQIVAEVVRHPAPFRSGYSIGQLRRIIHDHTPECLFKSS